MKNKKEMKIFWDEPILTFPPMVDWWRSHASKGNPPQKVECLGDLIDDGCKPGTMLAWWGWDSAELAEPFLGIFRKSYWMWTWDNDTEEDVAIPAIRVDWLHGDLHGSNFEIVDCGYDLLTWNGNLFIL